MNNISGHVYLDGQSVSGVYVEAVSVDGTDRVNTTTGDDGAYTLNIKPETKYNLTATRQGLRHTVWPASLPGDMNIYNINLTSTPTSTIVGSGYMIGGPIGHEFNHTRHSDSEVTVTSVQDNTTITTLTDNNGSYFLEVEPNVQYKMNGNYTLHSGAPSLMFYYRNDGYFENITVGPNETALVDYIIPMP